MKFTKKVEVDSNGYWRLADQDYENEGELEMWKTSFISGLG